MTVENYHLRWDSHLTHLNTSIAALYRNDKYADVMLYSSTPGMSFPRIGISAHKFILSSSSQFFASIFDSSLTTTSSGVFHIVLPPDLTQRTIQILVQYMYSGEATVPNDILSEVLRGGELLKIRGLCRATPANSEEIHKTYPKTTPIESSNCPRFANELRGLGASVLPETSPVIVKSPKPPPPPPPPPQAQQMGLLRIVDCSSLGGGINVNKEVAIDPDPDPYLVRSSCRESGCTGCPDRMDMECPIELPPAPKLTMRNDLHRVEKKPIKVYGRPKLDAPSSPKLLGQPMSEEPSFQIKEEPSDSWHGDQSNCDDSSAKPTVPKLLLKLKVPRDTVPAPIKVEAPTSCDDEEPPPDLEPISYTRLTCELCKTYFDEPKAWVKHIESHSEKPEAEKDSDNSSSAFGQPPTKMTCLPKKRKRPYDSPHVTLMCDLCKRSFTTPAEWVRHINTQHTETELAVFNSQRKATHQQKHDADAVRYSRRPHSGGMYKA